MHCWITDVCSYPCSLLVEAPAGGDHEIAIRLGDGLGICGAIQEKKGRALLLGYRVKDGQRQWQSSDAKHVVYEKRSEIAVASSATRTGEVFGRVTAADEVVRRLGRPELLPELAAATLTEEEKS
jgi:hypothetical protein